MKTITTFLTTVLLTATTLTAQDVFIAGYDNDGTSSNIAQIWEEDGTKHNLTNGTQFARANSVFVYNNDVYAAGYEYNGTKYVAKIWKNGIPQNLTNGTQHARANAVFVYDGDVYAAGYEENGTKLVAKAWKNGVVQNLTDGSKNAHAESIFVSNGDVYVVGIEYDYSVDGNNVNSVIKLWINGTAQDLTSGFRSVNAKSIFVHGTDVYVAGNEHNGTEYIAKVWKNGNAQNLTDGSSSAVANSVFVSNGNVYVAGYEYIGAEAQPRLWINGVEEPLNYDTNKDGGQANSVYVSGSDIYVAGTIKETNSAGTSSCSSAAFWKNGQVQFISASPSCVQNTAMFSVFVDDNPLSIENISNPKSNFNVYPNPAQDVLHIDVQVSTNLQLYSLQGQLLQEITAEQNTQVDISNLAPGVYFIKDKNGNTTQKTVKFIKE